MYSKIPVAILNEESPKVFKKILKSFVDKHKDAITRFPLIVGINNAKDNIGAISEEIPYIKEILCKDMIYGSISLHRCLAKMMTYKPKAAIFIPSGCICIKSLVPYVNDMLFTLKNDDTIGGFYLGRNKPAKEKFTGNHIFYDELPHNNFYRTSMGFQYEPFLLRASVAIELLSMRNNIKRMNRWYVDEGYKTLGIEGGCFQKYD